MEATDLLVLPEEVLIFPVATLAPPVRAAIGCDAEDYAVTRKRSRRTTRVVDRAGAELMDEFRKPSSTIDAVRRFAQRAELPAQEVIESGVPLLNEMIKDGFIVAVGTEEETDGEQLRPGEMVGDWEVLEPLQLVEDTEVYRVSSPAGVEAALKRVLADAEPWVRAALENELRVLRRLGGKGAPKLLEEGAEPELPYAVISWCEGTPLMSAVSRVRRPWSSAGRRAVDEMCAAVLAAYVELHDQGVIHGDVHPRNLIFDGERGQVQVVDFGLARVADEEPRSSEQPGGVPAFFSPELAAASLAGERAPAPTTASEQYCLAALLYNLVTGEEYLPPVLDQRGWLTAVCTDPPRAFTTLALPASPAVEAVLARALSKESEERFASTAEFRDRFVEAVDADERGAAASPSPRAWTPPGLFDALSARFDLDGDVERVLSAPTATVNYGSAGIAYLLYRASCFKDRPDLLGLADVWIERAKLALAESPADACFSVEMGLEPDSVGQTALYHSAVGVHCVDALVSCVLDDRDRAEGAIDRFIATAQTTEVRDDLTTGRAGHLLGCACLLEAARAAGYTEGPLLEFGRRRQEELTGTWTSCAATVAGAGDPYLGVAHGWAGLAFASLRFSALSFEPVAPAVVAGLEELESLAQRDGDRAWWPTGPADEEVWPGWCHGSAGHAMLWAQAHRVLADERFLDLARAAAEHSWIETVENGQLCCGSAGQAYASLCVHRLTGEGRYADRARAMLERSMTYVGSPGMRRDSLYKGDVGVALLEADLAEPYLSAMPLFESEGWPS